jgi:hypothetical protein
MKVYLGPYKNYFGPYQLAEALCFWAKPIKDDYRLKQKPEWVSNFGHYLSQTWIGDFLAWVDSKRTRTTLVKIDNYDVWGMDTTLALIILPMLKKLKETKHGVPYVNSEHLPSELVFTLGDNEILTFEQMELQWNWVLDEMIWAFEQIQPDADWELLYQQPTGNTITSPIFNGLPETKFDLVGYQLHADRMKRGFALFGQYFQALWT